jgi:tRNA-Thr(GGU) m(6)t(6)A37 methyltransferase TsaA
MSPSNLRPGEVQLATDPATAAGDARVVFIGRVRSSWEAIGDAPKNPTRARESGKGAVIEIDVPFRPGLQGLAGTSHILVVAWLHESRRDVIVVHPKHVPAPRGVFSLRSPVRPNPIGISVARIVEIDEAAGRILIDAIDFLDGTPLLDIKPYRPGIDSIPDAVVV